MGAACKKVKVKVKDSVLGELLQLEELPGPLLLDNMQDEVHSTTHTYTHTYTYTFRIRLKKKLNKLYQAS